jgi:tRNA threonylcarbamoyl adenosine modification protein YeaZ
LSAPERDTAEVDTAKVDTAKVHSACAAEERLGAEGGAVEAWEWRPAEDPFGGAPDLALCIDASARPASAAAWRAGRLVEVVLSADRQHASDLLPALQRLVEELGARPRDARLVVVGTGPGSYTGLRVAIATALGLARAAQATALGIPSGEALCLELCAEGESCTLALDARSGGTTLATYRRRGADVEVVHPPEWVPIGAAARRLSDAGLLLVDATVPDLCGFDEGLRARCRASRPPRASHLLRLGLARRAAGARTPLDELAPLYLREFEPTARKR